MIESLPLLGVVLVVVLVLLALAHRNEPRAPKMPRQWEQEEKLSSTQWSLEDQRNARRTEMADTGRIRITHPMVRRAAEKALGEQGGFSQHLAQEGDDLFFVLDSIADPDDRRRAFEILSRIEADEGGDMSEVMWLMRRLSGK